MIELMRGSIKSLISFSPTVVSIYRCAMVDNGLGGMVREAGRGSFIAKARIRISHSSAAIQGNSDTPAGLSASLSLYALTDYREPLAEGDSITDGITWWSVGPVNPLRIEGSIYAFEAPLSIVERSNTEPILDGGEALIEGNLSVFDSGEAL